MGVAGPGRHPQGAQLPRGRRVARRPLHQRRHPRPRQRHLAPAAGGRHGGCALAPHPQPRRRHLLALSSALQQRAPDCGAGRGSHHLLGGRVHRLGPHVCRRVAILEPGLRVVPCRGVLPAAAEPPRHPRREPARRALCPEAVGGVADGAVGQSGPAAAEGRRPRCAGRGSRADRRARRGAVDGSRVVPPVRGVPVLRARLLGRVQLLVQGRGGLLDRHDGRVAAERCGAEELLLPLGGVRQPASPEDGQHGALTEPDVPLTGQAQEHGGAGLPGEATGLLHDHDLARESVPDDEPELLGELR
mmetsp:Transcript_23454/g.60157  ORF Transcript_23454/g.60157 Transcript_23454/m.60157 type:complete len:303 (-) Transcript_23454:309-1217(-)